MQCTYLNVNFAFPVDKGPVVFKIVFFVGSHNIRQKITLRWKQHSNWKLQVPPSNLLKQELTTLNRNFSLLNVLVLGNKAFNVIGLVITCLKLANESVCTDIFTRLVWKLANQGWECCKQTYFADKNNADQNDATRNKWRKVGYYWTRMFDDFENVLQSTIFCCFSTASLSKQKPTRPKICRKGVEFCIF